MGDRTWAQALMESPLEREIQMEHLPQVPKRWLCQAMLRLRLPPLRERAQRLQAHQREPEKPLQGFLRQAVLLADRAARRDPILRVYFVDPVRRQQPDRPSRSGGRPSAHGLRYVCHVPIHSRSWYAVSPDAASCA
jgi:hypothetical protein